MSKKRGSASLVRKTEVRDIPPLHSLELQCVFFAGQACRPKDGHMCDKPGKFRERNLVFCDLHYEAMLMDPKDWTDEMLGY